MSVVNSNADADAKKYTYAVYILQALAFVFLVTAIVGIIINYIKDEDVKGTWLESHFEWQKNTFWYGLLWITLGALTGFLLIGYVVVSVALIWLMYRIAKGWIYLVDGKELYR
jgi:uncharacterized membrane protein